MINNTAIRSAAARFPGTPLLVAHGCALLERDVGKGYSYRAVNLQTGESDFLCGMSHPLTTSGVDEMLEKLRFCSVAISEPLEVDMQPGDSLSHAALDEILSRIFREILPVHGYSYREAQTELSAHILNAIHLRTISLAEGEVGSGKTLAYLIAAVLAKRGRVNDFWLRGSYTGQSFADSAYMPVVISTSSIALQNAIMKDYIPNISRILVEHGVIRSPLTAVIRKGREHYLCEHRFRAYYADADIGTKKILAPLLDSAASIDLAELDSLTPYMKRRIGVPRRCVQDCSRREQCRYRLHIKAAHSSRYDFQITNHNYYLADILRRKTGQTPLIPHYQAVIIDEGHKLLSAARQMYGVELDNEIIPEITGSIRTILFRGSTGSKIWRKARKLYGQHKELSRLLRAPASDEERDRTAISIDAEAERHLRNVCLISDQLLELLEAAEAVPHHQGRRDQAVWLLNDLRDRAAALENHRDMICWLESEKDSKKPKLCAIPKNLGELLHADLWSKGIPVIITSGTLSAAGSFERVKRTLGLDKLPSDRVMEIRKPSPFNYRNNALLYISKRIPFPDNQDVRYLAAVAAETEELIRASHGHAAVLFTSYKAMDKVWERLTARRLPFPMFRLDRGSVSAISGFKESKGGVLFASGTMWEGIDIPGDALSLLIIVRLPFAVPDPIGEYERSQYGSLSEYKGAVIQPDMLIRLRQAFGRPFRLESDTGIVVIFDSRALETYRDAILNALPGCRVTTDIADVPIFLREKKDADYFLIN